MVLQRTAVATWADRSYRCALSANEEPRVSSDFGVDGADKEPGTPHCAAVRRTTPD